MNGKDENKNCGMHCDSPPQINNLTLSEHTVEVKSAAVNENATEIGTNSGAEIQPADGNGKKRNGRVKEWFKRHKPTKRRLIQIYAALLYNCYLKGFVSGKIFTGITKTACVPGLNCYSCPGAVGACPLGALSNALAGTKARAPYYVIGILLLYGLIFARTICGFLCPVGLGQDLLYKIKTPKVKKSKITRILSYFKYVLLFVLVIGIPLIYAVDRIAVPGFCKYVCPAGTFGGAIMLLLHPSNTSLYGMLGPLFTWKMVVLIAVITACIFIYRAFCRFLCPLGAIYGLFNRFSLLGIRVDKSKCTDCGKCINKCKMDVKKVGDHECINCGECINSCPTKAISFKGGKIFVNDSYKEQRASATLNDIEIKGENDVFTATVSPENGKNDKRKNKITAIKVISLTLALMLFAGTFTYANFFAVKAQEQVSYKIEVAYRDRDKTGNLLFEIGSSDKYVVPSSGTGTSDDPYVINSLSGKYAVAINTKGSSVYFVYKTSKKEEYIVNGTDDLTLKAYYMLAGSEYATYDYETDGANLILDMKKPEGYGNSVGFKCYDFTLDGYNGIGSVTLTGHRGKVVVINFWGTWCGPCVTELPSFESVRKQYDIEVIAIHSATITEDVEQFIAEKKWNEWGIIFAQDTGNGNTSDIYDLLGGRGSYPRTVIVDKEGIIRHVIDGSVREETLQGYIKSLI